MLFNNFSKEVIDNKIILTSLPMLSVVSINNIIINNNPIYKYTIEANFNNGGFIEIGEDILLNITSILDESVDIVLKFTFDILETVEDISIYYTSAYEFMMGVVDEDVVNNIINKVIFDEVSTGEYLSPVILNNSSSYQNIEPEIFEEEDNNVPSPMSINTFSTPIIRNSISLTDKVKFWKGTKDSYNQIKTNGGSIDNNTIYFITDTKELCLGTIVISTVSNVAWGTETSNQKIDLDINGTKKSISLSTHTHDYISSTTVRPANTVLAGPSSGNNAAPTFRKLVAADIPSNIVYTDSTQTISGIKTFTGGGNRLIKMVNGSIRYIASDGEWANGFTARDKNDETNLATIGFYGSNDILNYAYIGTTYENPWLKINESTFSFNNNNVYHTGNANLSSIDWNAKNLKLTGLNGTGDVYMELWRGTNASWKLINNSGVLRFQSNYVSSAGSYYDAMTLAYNSGNLWTKGSTNSSGFIKNGSSDSYVLLGGGGHKTLASITGDYLPLSGGKMTGAIDFTSIADGKSIFLLKNSIEFRKVRGRGYSFILPSTNSEYQNNMQLSICISDSIDTYYPILSTYNVKWQNGTSQKVDLNIMGSSYSLSINGHTHDYISSTTVRAANTVLAGPSSGNNAAPTFRKLVAADIPSNIVYTDSTQTITGVKIFTGGGNRKVKIVNGSVIYIASDGGWTNGFTAKSRNEESSLATIGFFGLNDDLEYAYIGPSYDKPWMKVNASTFAFNNYDVYHAGNANLNTIPWKASSLTLSGAISGATTITASGVIQGSQLKSTISVGTAPLVVNSSTMVSNLNANYLNGLISNRFLWNSVYNYSNGILVKLNILAETNSMITLLIKGNSYNESALPIDSTLQFYNYKDINNILKASLVNNGYPLSDVKIFIYDGYVHVWFSQRNAYQSYSLYGIHTNNTLGNIIDRVSNAAMPTTGVTREVSPTVHTSALLTDNVASADVASKLGTADIGSSTRLMYLNKGVATTSSATVGTSTKPVYLNNGTVTACGGTLDVAISGNAATSDKTYTLRGKISSVILTTPPSDGELVMHYNTYHNTEGCFPTASNANAIITLNRHKGSYYSQLGFSSNGLVYYRNLSNVEINTTTPWKQLAFTDSSISGNAETATKLATPVNINATSFDGSAAITTDIWGKSRNLTIGNKTIAVNGAADGVYNWSLTQIGIPTWAQAASKPTYTFAEITSKPTTMTGYGIVMNETAWDTALNNAQVSFNSSSTNSPYSGGTAFGITMCLQSNKSYAGALAMRNDNLYFRTKEGTTIHEWRSVYHSGNFNPDLKANLEAPTFTNKSTTNVPSSSDVILKSNPVAGEPYLVPKFNNQIATAKYVQDSIDQLIGGAPGTLNTLKEISDWLGHSDGGSLIELMNTKVSKSGDEMSGKLTIKTSTANQLTIDNNGSNEVSIHLKRTQSGQHSWIISNKDGALTFKKDTGSGTDLSNVLNFDSGGNASFEKVVNMKSNATITGNLTISKALTVKSTTTLENILYINSGLPITIGGGDIKVSSTTTGEWARGFHFISNDTNKTILASFGAHGEGVTVKYAYIGDAFSTPWLKINATDLKYNDNDVWHKGNLTGNQTGHTHSQYLDATIKQLANYVLAGPSSGNSTAPLFRKLVSADIPNLDWSKITSGKPTTLDGYGITNGVSKSGTTSTATVNVNLNDIEGNSIKYDYRWDNKPSNIASNIASVLDLTYSPDWRSQMFFMHADKTAIFVRSRYSGTTWGGWRELAFKDSSITGNASSASTVAVEIGTPNGVRHLPYYAANSGYQKTYLCNGMSANLVNGTTTTVGTAEIYLGNALASTTNNNYRGSIRLYGSNTGYTTIVTGYNSTGNIAITLPASAGTLALSNQTMYIGTTALAINRASGALTLAGVSITGGSVSATTGAFSGIVNISNTTESSSATTGALIVAGGVGISKQLRVTGATTLSSTLTASGTIKTNTSFSINDNVELKYNSTTKSLQFIFT